MDYFCKHTENAVNVTLTLVREQGSSGDVKVLIETRPAFHQPPFNQATAGQDFIAKTETIIMKENTIIAFVTITILPVRIASYLVY